MNSYKSNIKIDKINNEIYEIKYKNSKYENLFLDNKNLIPNFNHNNLSFNIYNTKSSFVNAIRRCIIDELYIKTLYYDIVEFSSDDKFLLSDFIQNRIQLLSIKQDILQEKKFSLNVYNNTTKIIPIKSNSIINQDDKDTTIYFNQNIKLCDLKPNKSLNINNIMIKSEYGYNNNIYSIGKASFEVINLDMDKNQSLNTDASDFTFYVYSNGNIHPNEILIKTVETLTERLDNINNLIKSYNEDELNNDEMIINKNEKISSYYIKNEYHTLGNLLIDYMYELDTTTKLLNYNNDHPSKNEITIKTDNPDSDNLFYQAISNIKTDLQFIKNTFILN